MFRTKKGASQASEPAVETPPVTEAPAAMAEPTKPEPRRGVPLQSGRPLPHAAFALDLSRRSSELSQIAGRSGDGSHASVAKDKVLTVGREVEVRGEVAACDRLVVDGVAHLTLTSARLLQIGSSGTFNGIADIVEADIAGRFDGDLTVRERLTIRASGQVRGRIRYGQIVIEAGGEVSGDIGTLDGQVRVPAAGLAASGADARAATPSPSPFSDVMLTATAD
jgi:cytoskeletal protein CcmA (bactofilin family)